MYTHFWKHVNESVFEQNYFVTWIVNRFILLENIGMTCKLIHCMQRQDYVQQKVLDYVWARKLALHCIRMASHKQLWHYYVMQTAKSFMLLENIWIYNMNISWWFSNIHLTKNSPNTSFTYLDLELFPRTPAVVVEAPWLSRHPSCVCLSLQNPKYTGSPTHYYCLWLGNAILLSMWSHVPVQKNEPIYTTKLFQ